MNESKKLNIKFVMHGVNPPDIKNAIGFLTSPFICCLMTISCILTRCQVSASQGKDATTRKEIQGLPSMKYNAKLFTACVQIAEFINAITVCATAVYNAAEYQTLDTSDRQDYIQKQINEVSSPGKAKILSSKQISNEENLAMHRRGLAAQIRGRLQANALFEPNKFLLGMSVINLKWSMVIPLVIDYIKQMAKIEVDINAAIKEVTDCLDNLDISYEHCLDDDNMVTLTELSKLLFKELYMSDMSELCFEDGLLVNAANVSNIVLLEEPLQIYRTLPADFKEVTIKDKNDPFLAIASQQQEKLIENIKVRNKNSIKSNKRK